MAVTAAVSLNSFGLSSSLASRTQSMIFAVSSAFCETTSPCVPSPPCGQDRLYSTPIAPAFCSLRVLDCQTRLVRFVVAGDRTAGRGERQAIREFLDELFDFAADAVERMAGNIVAIAVSRAGERKHVAGGNVNRHVIECGLHHAAGPAALVGLAHLVVAVRVRRGGEKERRENPAAKEIGVERHRTQRHTSQD